METHSDSIINITKAIVAVTSSIEGIEKTKTVGEGRSAYKAIEDKEVKRIVGRLMAKNGLCIVPINITSSERFEQWDEVYNGQPKRKTQVFASVTPQYLLMHTSGEWIKLSGYGHGVDSQDKSAGKATTYALKYLLLYTFLVPTGDIDDSDNTHSDDAGVPLKNLRETPEQKAERLRREQEEKEAKEQAAKEAFAQQCTSAIMAINNATTLDELAAIWKGLPKTVGSEINIKNAKDNKKALLNESVAAD